MTDETQATDSSYPQGDATLIHTDVIWSIDSLGSKLHSSNHLPLACREAP